MKERSIALWTNPRYSTSSPRQTRIRDKWFTTTRSQHLNNTRNHGKLLFPVFSTKFLPVPSLLLLRPHAHLCTCDGHEEHGSPTSGDQAYANPCHDLIHVIWACYDAETKTLWYATCCCTRWAQILENNVSVKVADFAEREECKTKLSKRRGSGKEIAKCRRARCQR